MSHKTKMLHKTFNFVKQRPKTRHLTIDYRYHLPYITRPYAPVLWNTESTTYSTRANQPNNLAITVTKPATYIPTLNQTLHLNHRWNKSPCCT